MSGKSNVVFWLERHGFEARDELVERLFQRAKSSRSVLTEQEILREIEHTGPTRLDG